MWPQIYIYLKDSRLQRVLLLGCAILCFVLLLRQCEKTKESEASAKQNFEALKGDLIVIKDKLGNPVTESAAFVASIDELKKLNLNLYNEIKNMKGDIKSLAEFNIAYIDTVKHKLKDTIIFNNSMKVAGYDYISRWIYQGNQGSLYTEFEGESHYSFDTVAFKLHSEGSVLNKSCIKLDLISGIEKSSDGIYRTFVKPKLPTEGLSFNIESAIVDKSTFGIETKDRWAFGPVVSIGVGGPVTQFKIFDTFNWQLGFGLTYNLFSW